MDDGMKVFYGIGLLILLLGIFWMEHKDDPARIANIQEEINRLNETNLELLGRIDTLGLKNDELKSDYDELEKETTTLLAKYALEETFWDLIGLKKLRILCDIGKITFREEIPDNLEIPC